MDYSDDSNNTWAEWFEQYKWYIAAVVLVIVALLVWYFMSKKGGSLMNSPASSVKPVNIIRSRIF